MFRFTPRLFAAFVVVALVFSASPLPRAWADDGRPPQPTAAQVVEVVSSTTLNGPDTTGPIPGPNGEWAVLTSMLTATPNGCWPFGCTWQLQGAAKVEVSQGPTAKAWTTLFGPNGYLQASLPCHAGYGGRRDCTSATQWFQVGHGYCHNDAETAVQWTTLGYAYDTHTVAVNL